MDMGLKGKVALVVASSKGLGKAVAMGLAREGTDVTICARGEEALQATAYEIEAATGAQVLALRADVTRPEDVDRVVDETVRHFGHLDILVINAGETAGEVPATCTVPGITGNGFMLGQINEIITPLPFEVAAENVTESTGGAADEDDEAFRLRIAEAFERISKAGPRAAYEQMVRAFSPAIVDVGVTSPEPGIVHIHVLTDEGAPSQDMLLAIRAWIDPETRRPLTDAIEVLAPVSVPVNVEAHVVARGDLMTVQQQVQDAIRQAADVWRQRLGEYLSTSAITCALGHVEEIVDIDVTITGVDDRQLQPNQFAVLTDVTVNMEAAA